MDEQFDSCYTYGSPRTENPEFIDSIISDRIYRIINNCGIVTAVPTNVFFNRYQHIGQTYLIDNQGKLVRNMSDAEISKYPKEQLQGMKQYVKSKFLNKEIHSIKEGLPEFLANHAPLNYVNGLTNLITSDDEYE